MKDLSIIVPAYNEGKNIFNCIKEIEKSIGNPTYDYEIIVIDNASTDNTYKECLRAVSENDRVKVFRCMEKGKGNALKHSIQFVNGNLITFIDADLDLHPRQIPLFIEYMKKYDADVVVGSKRHPLSKVRYPFFRRILSDVYYYFFVKLFFGLPVKDTQTGLKLFKYEVLKKVVPKVLCKRYAFDLELLVNIHKHGFKIVEAPIDLNFKRFRNRIGLKAIWNIFVDTAAIFYRLNILHYYDD